MDAIGWASSSILVLTLFTQVWKQWSDDTSKGVSPWLFIGQLCASTGFLVYSLQIHSWVFVFTNVLAGIAAVLGLLILWRHATRRRRQTT